MTVETFSRLLPAIAKTKLAYLQGWGEPFLHPEIFTLMAMAKKTGCQVGATTNGMALDDEAIRRLVELGVDIIAFSLAGTDEENDKMRVGTRFEHVLDAIKRLHLAKEKAGASRPEIHIAYLLLRSQWKKLENLPSLLQGAGVSQAVITTLDFVSDRSLEKEMILPQTTEERILWQTRLDAAVEEGKRCGVPMYYYLAHPQNASKACTENVQRALFISADGAVSPCVFANIPAAGVDYYVHGAKRSYEKMTFGALHHQTINSIWRQKNYVDFRNSFESNQCAEMCRSCPKRCAVLSGLPL